MPPCPLPFPAPVIITTLPRNWSGSNTAKPGSVPSTFSSPCITPPRASTRPVLPKRLRAPRRRRRRLPALQEHPDPFPAVALVGHERGELPRLELASRLESAPQTGDRRLDRAQRGHAAADSGIERLTQQQLQAAVAVEEARREIERPA